MSQMMRAILFANVAAASQLGFRDGEEQFSPTAGCWAEMPGITPRSLILAGGSRSPQPLSASAIGTGDILHTGRLPAVQSATYPPANRKVMRRHSPSVTASILVERPLREWPMGGRTPRPASPRTSAPALLGDGLGLSVVDQ